MSGKSGQLLTSSFYDDCENIVLYNGYPVFAIRHDDFFKVANSVAFSSFEDASKRLGLSVDVLKDLTRLANVNLLDVTSARGGSSSVIVPVSVCITDNPHSTSEPIVTTIDFGNISNGLYTLTIRYDIDGNFVQGVFEFAQE